LFVTITGVTSGNVPASPSTTGDWVPPTIAAIGKKLIITHPGFSGSGSNFFGVLDVTNPAAPTWTATNTTTNALPSVPTSVANYNNRAWYACGNLLYFSDSLNPTVITNSTQAVTVGDMTNIVAQSGLPIQTTSSGVIASLAVFKSNQIWLVTGDLASSNLGLAFSSLTVGCSAPRSVVQTPIGIIFISQDAPYVLAPNGVPMELRNSSGIAADLREPFQLASYPTRMAAAYASNIYRICVQTTIQGVAQTNDYWFDLRRMRWTGPHSFVYDCASQHNNSFVLSGPATGAALFGSNVLDRSLSTIYNDNGAAIVSSLTSAFLTNAAPMSFKQTIESNIDLSSGGLALQFAISATDDYDNQIAVASVTTPAPAAIWGQFNWGDGTLWAATKANPRNYGIDWNIPVVWDRMSLNVNATSSSDVSVGKSVIKYQVCGYENRPPLLTGLLTPALPPPGQILDVNFILDQSTLS